MDEDLIRDAEKRRHAALAAVDMPALDALFCDDLVHVHSNAMVHNKTELLAYIAEKRAFVSIDRGPLTIRVTGDCAIMTGAITNHMRRPDGGKATMNGFVTQVLRREAGQWRFASFHFTLAPA
jgi:ketosteroid isomerase-like protein